MAGVAIFVGSFLPFFSGACGRGNIHHGQYGEDIGLDDPGQKAQGVHHHREEEGGQGEQDGHDLGTAHDVPEKPHGQGQGPRDFSHDIEGQHKNCGLDVLLEACSLLAEEACRPKVVITHFDPRFRHENVTATGWLTHEETRMLYGTADICVVPSLWREPFGLTALEAMASGLPVCASRTGGLADSVVHEQTGLLFPSGDARALAAALKRLLDDAPARRAMGEAGRERVRALYTCLLYTSPSPRDRTRSRMPSSA